MTERESVVSLADFRGLDATIHGTKVANEIATTAENVDLHTVGVLKPRRGLARVSVNPASSALGLLTLQPFDRLNEDLILLMQTENGTVEYIEDVAPAWDAVEE